jgi:hypothetical protein
VNLELEYYLTKYRITEWKDDSVYRTEKLETGWFDAVIVDTNKPGETDLMFVPANDEFAKTNPMVRAKKVKRDV